MEPDPDNAGGGKTNTLHDYLKGAYEALSWVKLTLKEKPDVEKVLEEVNGAINDITEGVAVDFRERLKTVHYP